jgi:hydroxylamine reductase
MDTPMFCYQCEQTARGAGCTLLGTCGKDSRVSALQDLLVYQLEGLACYADSVLARGGTLDPAIDFFTIDALYATLTNVNFDPARFHDYLREAQAYKSMLRTLADPAASQCAAATYDLPADAAGIEADAAQIDIRPLAAAQPDIQSLRDTVLYGLKGMAAYAHHAWVLGYKDASVVRFLYKALASLLDDTLGLGDLLSLALELGRVNLACMELLDRANTIAFGHPAPAQVSTTLAAGPCIVVSGHDLADLALLLDQTAGKGILVYTHGEMLPAHGYPELRKHLHLAGNFGGAWQNQQSEFARFPGAILMTTNCLLEPRTGYAGRIFTSGVVGWPDTPHIEEVNGAKDFTPVIEKALELGGLAEDEAPGGELLTGFAHNALLSNAGAIVDAVKAGHIRHFFLIGGCDGAKAGRNYYTRFAEQTPADTLMLTLACGKYRFNDQDFGAIGPFPRLLDVGQCNDAYSAIRVASALAEAFNCGVNDLPLSMVLSWFEQKAVCILLTLLSLGIKDMYLGPTLPAFITPNVLQVLVDQYNLRPITTPEADMARMLKE